MSLNVKEISNLMSILAVEQCSNTSFENINQQLQRYFTKQDSFKVGSALVLLLQNPDLLPSRIQQLVALYLLFELTRSDPPHVNPFQVVFIHALRSDEASDRDKRHFRIPCLPLPERLYFYALLQQSQVGQPPRELLKKTPQQVISSAPPTMYQSAPELDLNFLEAPVNEKMKELPMTSKVAMPCILSDQERKVTSLDSYSGPAAPASAEAQRQVLESLLTGEQPPVRNHLRPEFLLLAPPLHCVGTDDELVWMTPTQTEHTVQWDASMGQGSTSAEIRKLMMRAFKQALPPHQSKQLTDAISQDPKLVSLSGMSPNRLPELVEYNPLVAIEVLLTLMKSGSQITDYFSVLVNMEMSLHSMEVVNRLTTSVELPAEFMELYISNCITSCESTKDKYMQNRLVRLVCVFLQSLIRNKIIDVNHILIEVQSFCLEFNRIREAAGLYRLLKSLDSGDASADLASIGNANNASTAGSNQSSAGNTPSKS